MMNLLIISHTEHYKNSAGEVVGWGPTVREINYLASHFEKIYHCAPLYLDTPPLSSLPYEKDNISFVPLMPAGGRALIEKLNILFHAPGNISIISKTLKKADVFQFRAPTGMGVYLIPYLIFFVKKPGWFKYAGNWKHSNPPLGYRIQKTLLIAQKRRKVTINGQWPDQPAHCITFENPCLTDEELRDGELTVNNKDYSGKLNFCFVGRLERSKGVMRVLELFEAIGGNDRIGRIHFIGDGNDRNEFERRAGNIKHEVIFHGFMNRNDLVSILKESHVFLLLSDSEGFPKSLAEAANYGCVPFVSDVSGIAQYVKNGFNGWVIKDLSLKNLLKNMDELLTHKDLRTFALKAAIMSRKFTFEYYSGRIINEIINQKTV